MNITFPSEDLLNSDLDVVHIISLHPPPLDNLFHSPLVNIAVSSTVSVLDSPLSLFLSLWLNLDPISIVSDKDIDMPSSSNPQTHSLRGSCATHFVARLGAGFFLVCDSVPSPTSLSA